MKSSILIVLAVGFMGFGALEVAALNPSENASARAKDASAAEPGANPSSSPFQADSGTPSIPPRVDVNSDQACLTPALVAAFEPRHLELLDREAKLTRRAAELADLENALDAKLAEVSATRDELSAMTDRLDRVASEDISHLVDMYSTMKAKKAAAIFDRMDPAFAAGFLREIDSARAGLIMAEMGEEQSYRISLLIANRHAEWRKP
ncbi:MAG: hypothetical protein WBF53_03430 [Litorimonas sp.]